jgi:acid phosphatase
MVLTGCASVPPSLPEIRDRLHEWVETGGYEERLEAVLSPAERFLDRHAPRVERPAIVLDIDDTSLSTWAYQSGRDFCYTAETFDEWVTQSTPPALGATLDLYERARRRGVAVFFVTGRREPLRTATERSLRAAGYTEWQALVLRPGADRGPVTAYKSAARRAIEAEGYTILLNVGDQQSDLAGGHARRAMLLPNPFYEID